MSGLAVGAGLLIPATRTPRGPSDASTPAGDGGNSAGEIATDLLIVGAGPFGLALAAQAQHAGIRHVVVGASMGFWRHNMPRGMHLRSSCDWSLDPLGVHSIEAYLRRIGRTCAEVEPLSRDFYLDYAGWLQREKDIHSRDLTVRSLHKDGAGLVAVTEHGSAIRSLCVVLATGFGSFAHVPAELASLFPRDRYDHTCDLVDFGALNGRRVLVVGGRQSAFEWAALMRESGAQAVHLSYRHDTPAFEASDWSWVTALVDRMADDPGWYRRLSPEQKQQLDQRFWSEGRLKLEPWLAPRLKHSSIQLHPHTRVTGSHPSASGLEVTLDSGDVLTVDHVVLATGYKVDLARVSFLANGLLSSIATRDGFPVLDEHFETSVPGLYITSLASTRDFGSFLAFTVSARAQAQIIGRDIAARLAGSRAGTAAVGSSGRRRVA